MSRHLTPEDRADILYEQSFSRDWYEAKTSFAQHIREAEQAARRQAAEEFRARAKDKLCYFGTVFHIRNKHERAAAFHDAANIVAALPLEPELE